MKYDRIKLIGSMLVLIAAISSFVVTILEIVNVDTVLDLDWVYILSIGGKLLTGIMAAFLVNIVFLYGVRISKNNNNVSAKSLKKEINQRFINAIDQSSLNPKTKSKGNN